MRQHALVCCLARMCSLTTFSLKRMCFLTGAAGQAACTKGMCKMCSFLKSFFLEVVLDLTVGYIDTFISVLLVSTHCYEEECI